ncbi:MAG: prepilin-type N-terminal cleavage/methylation domain-containing protein [Dehalococcoidia bacterium]|nr:prepilin-type N-terminal cleavage/methylation domain-containing protein [Dehalococcoidia bacterium]
MSKRRRLLRFAGLRSALNSEQGLNLIEVLIALGILAAVATTFLLSMATSSKAVVVNQEQVSGESLAKSQMESIKQQDYRVDQQYVELDQVQIPTGYDIQIKVERLDPRHDASGDDEGLQKITIIVNSGDKEVFTLEGYKCLIGQ